MNGWFSRRSIATRLRLGFGAMVVLTLLVALIGYAGMRSLMEGADTITANAVPGIDTLRTFQAMQESMFTYSQGLLLEPPADVALEYKEAWAQNNDDASAALKTYGAKYLAPANAQLIKDQEQLWSDLVQSDAKVVALYDKFAETGDEKYLVEAKMIGATEENDIYNKSVENLGKMIENETARTAATMAAADAILKRNSENVPALTVRGQALLSQKRYREAAAAFATVVAKNPSIAGVRFDLGSSLAGAGDTAKAEAEWQKAIELEPHFAEPRVSLIAAALARGETEKAVALSKAATDSGAESPELSFEIGMTYANSGDLAAAEKWFQSAVRLRPAYAEALGNLGRIAYASGRVDEALIRYSTASRAAPDDSTYLKTAAAILLQDRHDLKGALAAFRGALAVERDPGERARLEAVIAELSKAAKP